MAVASHRARHRAASVARDPERPCRRRLLGDQHHRVPLGAARRSRRLGRGRRAGVALRRMRSVLPAHRERSRLPTAAARHERTDPGAPAAARVVVARGARVRRGLPRGRLPGRARPQRAGRERHRPGPVQHARRAAASARRSRSSRRRSRGRICASWIARWSARVLIVRNARPRRRGHARRRAQRASRPTR